METKPTHNVKDGAIGIHNIVDVGLDSVSNGLQGLTAVLVFYIPWFSTCAKPLLICCDKLLLPGIINLHTLREVSICVLGYVLTTLILARSLFDRTHVSFLDSDCHLKEEKPLVKHIVTMHGSTY